MMGCSLLTASVALKQLVLGNARLHSIDSSVRVSFKTPFPSNIPGPGCEIRRGLDFLSPSLVLLSRDWV